MLAQLGRLCYRNRWLVVVLWVALFAAGAMFAPRVNGVLRGGGYTIGNSQSVAAYNTLNRAYGYRALTFNVVFTASPGRQADLLPAAEMFRRRAQRLLGRQLDIRPPVWTPDRAVVFERVYSAPQEDFGAGYEARLRPLLPSGSVHAYLAGSAAIFHDMEAVSDQDVKQLEIVTLPIALIVLLLIFGSAVASAVPVMMAPISIALALAGIYFLGQRIDMSIFVLNTTSMLGLAVAIDYSLFMVNRFRLELDASLDRETAVANTVATSGRAILVSAIVVSVGFLALTLSGVSMLASLGIGGSLVTALSLILALTLLPAILGILGHRINALPVFPRRISSVRFWRGVALRVMRSPVPVIGAVVVIITILAIPAFHLRVGVPGAEILPTSVDSRAGNDILNVHLGLANQSPVLVVVRRDSHTSPSTYQAAAFIALDRICTAGSVVAGVAPIPVLDSSRAIRSCPDALAALENLTSQQRTAAGKQARHQPVGLLSVFLRASPSSAAAESFVTYLRNSLRIPGYQVLIGGQTAGQMDFDRYLYSRFPLVILFVVVTVFLVLLIAFQSLLLPIKAILMNGLSVLAAYGATVFAFEDGHLATLLGFTPVGNIDSVVPVFLFCVLFGVSTDYEVFLLTRVQEEYRRTGDNTESVAAGLEATGRIITSAAAVMIVVFGAFAFARLVIIKEVGFGLAVAVLVDATLIRIFLVPAAMRLLGRWNWWLPWKAFPTSPAAEPARDRGRSPAAE